MQCSRAMPSNRCKPRNCLRIGLQPPNPMQVHVYSMFGQRLPRHFSLGAAVKSEGVASAVIAGNVLVAQTVSGGICTAAACSCRTSCVYSSCNCEAPVAGTVRAVDV